MFSSLPSGRWFYGAFMPKPQPEKRVPSCKLSSYSMFENIVMDGILPHSALTVTSDKSSIPMHFSLITKPMLIYRSFFNCLITFFNTACLCMHYYGSCDILCQLSWYFCFMLCSISGSKQSFSRCFYAKQQFPWSNLVLSNLPCSRAHWLW